MNLKAVGRRFKAARERKHLIQEQLAEIVDLSPMHVSVIERSVKPPKLEPLSLLRMLWKSLRMNFCKTPCSYVIFLA